MTLIILPSLAGTPPRWDEDWVLGLHSDFFLLFSVSSCHFCCSVGQTIHLGFHNRDTDDFSRHLAIDAWAPWTTSWLFSVSSRSGDPSPTYEQRRPLSDLHDEDNFFFPLSSTLAISRNTALTLLWLMTLALTNIWLWEASSVRWRNVQYPVSPGQNRGTAVTAARVWQRGDCTALWKSLPSSQLTFPHPLCYRDLTKVDLPLISTERLKNKSPIPLSHTTNAIEKCKSKLQLDITSHLSEWPSAENPQTINCAEGVEKGEPSYTVGGNINWCSHFGVQYGGALKN